MIAMLGVYATQADDVGPRPNWIIYMRALLISFACSTLSSSGLML